MISITKHTQVKAALHGKLGRWTMQRKRKSDCSMQTYRPLFASSLWTEELACGQKRNSVPKDKMVICKTCAD